MSIKLLILFIFLIILSSTIAYQQLVMHFSCNTNLEARISSNGASNAKGFWSFVCRMSAVKRGSCQFQAEPLNINSLERFDSGIYSAVAEEDS